MTNEEIFKIDGPKPIGIGTGLVALDVIINGNTEHEPQLKAGGSCGNVLTILSYLGWKTYPIARFKNDIAAKTVIEDMSLWGVNTSLIKQNTKGSTPIVVQKIKKTIHGYPIHRFVWTCPNCGSFLPRYRSVLVKDFPTITKKMPIPSVFYFDRVSRSSIEIARESKKKGALVFFEPCGIKNQKQYLECLELSDIVKYSHENMRRSQEIIQKVSVPLEIETLGAEGLRFRFKRNNSKKVKWRTSHAYPVNNLKDTAGAGDWCSAGIIHLLGKNGSESFTIASDNDIDKAINFGQALAAINCKFEGARGIMYSVSKIDFQSSTSDLMKKGGSLESIEEKDNEEVNKKMVCFCPECRKKLRTSKKLGKKTDRKKM